MARIDHARTNSAERMRRNGVDRIDDYGIPAEFRAPPKRRQSKAALRAEIEAATAAITRIVRLWRMRPQRHRRPAAVALGREAAVQPMRQDRKRAGKRKGPPP